VTVCGCTALFRCVLVYWCDSAGLGWYPNAAWSTSASTTRRGHGMDCFIVVTVTTVKERILESVFNLIITSVYVMFIGPCIIILVE
jgi:hypothetical protein